MNPAQIVLIEDNPADVFLIELALKENGIVYELTRFASGEEAVQSSLRPDASEPFVPDAILLDLNTPRSDGFEVLAKLKQSPRFRGCAHCHHHFFARDQRQAPGASARARG